MNDLSFPFVMNLYRLRLKAERREDVNAIKSLQQHYPVLFTAEFEDFIEKAKLGVASLDQEHGENFSDIFSVEYKDINEKSH
jgi:hypothetical protein